MLGGKGGGIEGGRDNLNSIGLSIILINELYKLYLGMQCVGRIHYLARETT